MKNRILLQAISSWQAQSKHLRIYEKIELSERGKPQNMCMLQTKKISCLICGESGVTVPMKQ